MKLSLLIILFLVTACSNVVVRNPASLETEHKFGEVDFLKSKVKIFPPEIDKKVFRKFFYLELKDADGKFIDVKEREIKLLHNDSPVSTKVERTLRGRFYVTLEGLVDHLERKIDLYVKNRPMTKDLKVVFKKASRRYSKIKILHPQAKGKRMQLFLADSNGKPLEIPSKPEIIIEGQGEVEDLEHIGEGKWEFDLVFPDTNSIIYISVRAHGVYLESLFRIQHIEK